MAAPTATPPIAIFGKELPDSGGVLEEVGLGDAFGRVLVENCFFKGLCYMKHKVKV